MALQFSDTLRNAMLNTNSAITEVWNATLSSGSGGTGSTLLIWTGSVPANCAAANTGTELAGISLTPSTPFSVASSGAITLSGLTLSSTAGVSGTAGYFRIQDSSGTPIVHIQGTCGTSAADLIFNATAIVAGQSIQITGFTITAPGA